MKTRRIITIALYVVATLAMIYFFIYAWTITCPGIAPFDTDFYSRYQLHLWTHDTPEHFITFDQININDEFGFGNFRLSNSDYFRYKYELTVDDETSFNLYIRHAGHHTIFPYKKVIDLPDGVEDLREFQATAENSYVRVGDIEYGYVRDSLTGEQVLYGVEMVIDGTQFELFMKDLYYSDNPDSFIERLLHADTAEAARDEFAAHIQSKRKGDLAVGKLLLYWGVPTLIASGVVVFFVIRKKKRAKA